MSLVFGAKPRLAGPGGRQCHGRGASGQRPAQLHAGRPGRRGSEGSARAGALGHPERRPRIPQQQAHHGQPGAGRPAQGFGPLRPADRAGHPGRQRPDRGAAAGRPRIRGRAVAVRASCGRCAVRWPWRWRCTAAAIATRLVLPADSARGGGAGAGRRGLWRAPPARRGAAVSAGRQRGAGPSPRRRLGARAAAPGGTAAAPCRPGRRQGPCRRQARAGDRRGRRPQPADGGPAGLRQVDAGAALRRPAAGR